MVDYDSGLDEIAHIKFRIHSPHDDCLLLTGIELVEHVTCEAFEFGIYVVGAHATLDVQCFSYQIDHVVLEVQNNGKLA